MAEASLTAKGTASGLVRDIKCATLLVLLRCLLCKEDMLNCAAAGGCGPVGATCTWAADACWPVYLPAAVLQRLGRFPPSRYPRRFLDMDTAFWQVARQHWLQYGAYDDRTVPYLGAQAVWVWTMSLCCYCCCCCCCHRSVVAEVFDQQPAHTQAGVQAADSAPCVCCCRCRSTVVVCARLLFLTSIHHCSCCRRCRAVQGPAGQALAGHGLREQGGAGRG